MKILSANEKKRILNQLEESYGIEKLPYLLVQFGRDKLRAYSGALSRDELSKLDHNLRIENIGIYLAKMHEGEIRLSLDALHLLKNQITKNLIELTDEQAKSWFNGEDIKLDEEIQKGFVVLKHEEDFIGCGKSTGTIIKNYMPKERRVKS